MNNPQFYIFGVPDGFDIYNATPEKKNFFLSFYDGKYTGRSLMMVIYRNEDNNEVTYVYFRGNILAANGRPGSFLGMALTFQNGLYCTNAKLVHDLFEGMYIAVSNNKLLTTNVTNSQCQAQFLINKFVEQTTNIAALEQFVADQVAGWPAGSLAQIDSTFSSDPRSIELDMRNISWEHVIPNMKAVSWVYLTGLTADVPPVQQTQPQPVHDAESVNEVANKPNNQWPSNGGRTQSQTISQKRESSSTTLATHPYEQSYEERLKRLENDVRLELDTNYNNSIKSLQQRVRIMNTLKERVQKLNRERPNDKSLDKEREKIENEINNLNARIAAAEKRKRILVLALSAIVVVVFSVLLVNTCSSGSKKNELDSIKNELNTIEDTLESKIIELDEIPQELTNQQSYKNANHAFDSCQKHLTWANNFMSTPDPSTEKIKDELAKCKKWLDTFNVEWEKVKKVPEPDNKETVPNNISNNKDTVSSNQKGKKEGNKTKPGISSPSSTGWSWKITGRGIETSWSKREILIQSAVQITITVYNNGLETPVVWYWSGATDIQQKPLPIAKETELSHIIISRNAKAVKGTIQFYPKGHPEQKQTIKLLPE